jgi:cytochrome P450
MTDVIFDEHYNLLEKENNRHVLRCIEKSGVRTGTMCQWPRLKWDHKFGSWGKKLHRIIFADAIRNRNAFIGFVSGLMKARMSGTPIERSDIFTNLLNAKDPDGGARLCLDELIAESTSLIIAGKTISLF